MLRSTTFCSYSISYAELLSTCGSTRIKTLISSTNSNFKSAGERENFTSNPCCVSNQLQLYRFRASSPCLPWSSDRNRTECVKTLCFGENSARKDWRIRLIFVGRFPLKTVTSQISQKALESLKLPLFSLTIVILKDPRKNSVYMFGVIV